MTKMSRSDIEDTLQAVVPDLPFTFHKSTRRKTAKRGTYPNVMPYPKYSSKYFKPRK